MNVLLIENAPCPFCLSPDTAVMKPTKNMKPTVFCTACGTRAFIHSERANETFRWIMQQGIQFSVLAQQLQPSGQPVAAPRTASGGM